MRNRGDYLWLIGILLVVAVGVGLVRARGGRRAPLPTSARAHAVTHAAYPMAPICGDDRVTVNWSDAVSIEGVTLGMTEDEVKAKVGEPFPPIGPRTRMLDENPQWNYVDMGWKLPRKTRLLNDVMFRRSNRVVKIFGLALCQGGACVVGARDTADTVERLLGQPDRNQLGCWTYYRPDVVVRIYLSTDVAHPNTPVVHNVLLETPQQSRSHDPNTP